MSELVFFCLDSWSGDEGGDGYVHLFMHGVRRMVLQCCSISFIYIPMPISFWFLGLLGRYSVFHSRSCCKVLYCTYIYLRPDDYGWRSFFSFINVLIDY